MRLSAFIAAAAIAFAAPCQASGVATPPGFAAFVAAHPGDVPQSAELAKVPASEVPILRDINAAENGRIWYQRDHVWTLISDEGGTGDCKDYAISKRHALVFEYHIPIGATQLLWVQPVGSQNGSTHLVLEVSTAVGNYILDNIDEAPRGDFYLEAAMPYRILGAEDRSAPREWFLPSESLR